MSGFFGIFRPQGGPVDLDAFEQMRKATEREGFDGMETHVEEKIAMGHLMLRVSPESKHDKQPLKSSCGNYLLVGHFRLDYRDELGDKLGLTQYELQHTPDSKLVMLSYQKWKEKCVHHIEGDWAFALYCSIKNSIFLAKDKYGYSSLFYMKDDNQIFISTDINVFDKISSFQSHIDFVQLFRLNLNGFGLTEGRTLQTKIFHVKNSTYLTYNDELLLKELKYDKHLGSVQINYKYEIDYIHDFKNFFNEAVRTRILKDKKIGLMLSSGLDSSAIAINLDYECRKFGNFFYSFTSYPFFKNELKNLSVQRTDETIYLRELFHVMTNNISGKMNFPNSSMVDILTSAKTKDSFNPIVNYNTFWLNGILQNAKKTGIKQVYVGQYGNFTLSWDSPIVNFQHIFSRKIVFVFNYLFRNLCDDKHKFKVIIKSEIINPIRALLSWIKYSFNFFLKQKYFKDLLLDFNTILSKDFEKSFLRSLKDDRITAFIDSRKMKNYFFNKNGRHLGMKWFIDAHEMGLVVVDPTADARFVNYCFSIPEYLFNNNGIKKYIYKETMKSFLPEKIINVNKKSLQAVDIHFRILNDKKINDYQISRNKLVSSGKIKFSADPQKLFFELKSPKKSIFEKMLTSNKILKMYSLIEFLNKTPNFIK